MKSKFVSGKTIFRLVLFVCFICIVVSPGFTKGALEREIKTGTRTAIIDGTISENEYSFSENFGTYTIAASVTDSTVYLAVSGATTGWIALGFGSVKMDNSTLCIGTVKDGSISFEVHKGTGHNHSKTDGSSVSKYALTEQGNNTILEIAVPRTGLLMQEEMILPVMAAYGKTDNIDTYHALRSSFAFTIIK